MPETVYAVFVKNNCHNTAEHIQECCEREHFIVARIN